MKIFNDFTGINVFKEASVDTCVIQIKKDYDEENEVYINNKFFFKQTDLNTNSFIFNSPEVLELRKKILNQGIPIKELDIQINYGIKTGYNKAFIIDEETKNELIEKDSKNKEIIKPLLKGKDINKWQILYKKLYLIHSYDGLDIKEEYPSIYEFLSTFEERLKKRSDQGREWYNLRACTYDNLFEKEKIIYGEMSPEPHFTYDNGKYYLANTAYLISSEKINLKYLLGLLNSKLLFWMFKHISYSLGKSSLRFIKTFVEQLPIIVENDKIEEVVDVVDKILFYSNKDNLDDLNKDNQNEKIKQFTEDLDNLIYKIYNLDSEEINIIEESF